jgi:hypothetical protein
VISLNQVTFVPPTLCWRTAQHEQSEIDGTQPFCQGLPIEEHGRARRSVEERDVIEMNVTVKYRVR